MGVAENSDMLQTPYRREWQKAAVGLGLASRQLRGWGCRLESVVSRAAAKGTCSVETS